MKQESIQDPVDPCKDSRKANNLARLIVCEWMLLHSFSSSNRAHNSKIAKACKGCQLHLIGLSDPRLKGAIRRPQSIIVATLILWQKSNHSILRIALRVHPVQNSTHSVLNFGHRYQLLLGTPFGTPSGSR